MISTIIVLFHNTLLLHCQPRLVKSLEDFVGTDGDPMSLVCEFESDEAVSSDAIRVTWMKDGVEVKPSKDIQVSWIPPEARLTIQELLYPDDGGLYVCKARNNHGSVESTSRVTVNGKIKVKIASTYLSKSTVIEIKNR